MAEQRDRDQNGATSTLPNPKGEEALTGKVAQLLSHREIVINIGAAHGVRRGSRYKVISEPGDEVFDPDTHASLGRLEREKVRVEIIDVMEKMAVGRTYETRTVLTPAARFIRETLGERELAETIPLSKDSGWVKASDQRLFVEVGDIVKLIREDIDA